MQCNINIFLHVNVRGKLKITFRVKDMFPIHDIFLKFKFLFFFLCEIILIWVKKFVLQKYFVSF